MSRTPKLPHRSPIAALALSCAALSCAALMPPSAWSAAAAGTGVWANYDFVAGERILFLHDFEGARPGNFPSRLDYIAGNLEVVQLDGNQVLRVGEDAGDRGGRGCFTIALAQDLPERFTIEFRVRTSDPLSRISVHVFSGAEKKPDKRCTYPPKTNIFVGRHGAALNTPGAKSDAAVPMPKNEWVDVRIAVDGPYWKMYLNERRVANVPKLDFDRAASLHVFMNVYRHSLFIDDIRIAEGGPRSLYDDLQAQGSVTTTAIRFDSGSAVIRPESTAMLASVAQMLKEHPDLRLRIEGHTDSDGADDANLTLSQQRARAVSAFLAERGIDASRLDAQGFGEGKPVNDNATPEQKAQNRRVVFSRL